MRRAALALSAAGVVAVGAAVLSLREHFVPADEPALEQAVEQASAPAEAAPAPVDAAKQERIRRVAPEVVAQPQVAAVELQRVEPRQPLSRFAQPLPPRLKNQGRIHRPLITAAGQVAGSGLTVTIAGLEPTLADATCVDAAGAAWPCGMRARTAFRSFVRGRALACDLPEEITHKEYTVACTIGKQDVGAWLAANGWAKPLPGSAYAELGEAARAQAKGIFGQAPVVEPVEAAPPVDVAQPADLFPTDMFPVRE